MTTRAPAPETASRARSVRFAATAYGAVMTLALLAWGLWKNAQAAAECGSDCGRAMTLMLALGLVLVPAAATVGALAELAASRMSRLPRWIAHALGLAIVATVFVLTRHGAASALT